MNEDFTHDELGGHLEDYRQDARDERLERRLIREAIADGRSPGDYLAEGEE